jgi:hypothetical protein
MKHPAAVVCLLVSALAVAADQPAGPRPEREPEPRGDRRPEGQPQGNQPIVVPLPRGLPPGAYMLVPLPSQPGQPQTGRAQGQERPNLERPNTERPNTERPNIERPNVVRPNVVRPNADRPEAERPNGDRPSAQSREGQGTAVRPAAMLTPDEQAKLRTAMEKAGQEAAVKEAREVAQKAQKALEEARLNERKAAEAAALKTDPSLEPLFDKLRKGQSNQAPNRRGNERGEQPAR